MRQKKERRFNYFQKKIMIIAAGILNIAIVLSAAAVATYAWYRANAGVDIASESVEIATTASDERVEYKIYKYDETLSRGRAYTNPSDFTLPDYDTYITEKNAHANAIIRAEIITDELDTSTYEWSIDVTRLASAFMTDNKIGKFTSNVIQLKATVTKFLEHGEETYTNNTASEANPAGTHAIDETSDATIYSSATEYFASKNTPTTFVPIRYADNGTPIISRDDSEDSRTIVIVPGLPTGYSVDSVIMYLECSYHETLVDAYVSTNSTEGSTKYSLQGDISKILFSKRERAANTSLSTGKYIKVESLGNVVNGQYLEGYETDSSTGAGKIVQGSLANTNKAATSAGGLYADDTAYDVKVNKIPSNQPKSIDSTDTIDNNSLKFERTDAATESYVYGTFKSKAGYYIGNDTASNGVTQSSSSTKMNNRISFSGSENQRAIVNGYGSNGTYPTRLRWHSTNNRFMYSSNSTLIDLFRYTENVAEMPVLESIAITTQATKKVFYVGEKFTIPGLVVTATYSNGMTANVTKSCTFTSPEGYGPTSLVAGTTVLNTVAASKTIYVNYNEGGVTAARQSYTIEVRADELDSITITTPATTVNYYVGDTFSAAGLVFKATNKSGVETTGLTSESANVSITNPNMSVAQNNVTITVSYTGANNVTKSTTYTIHIYAKALSVNKESMSIVEGKTDTLTVTYNQNVTFVTSSNDGGTITLSESSPIAYSGDKTVKTKTITITAGHPGTVRITFSSSNVPDVTCDVTITETPSDHFIMTGAEVVTSSSYAAQTKTITKEYASGQGNESRDWVVTYGGGSNTPGTNSSHRGSCNLSSYSKYAVSPVTTSNVAFAYASTSELNKIKNITFTHTGGELTNRAEVYCFYSSDGNTFSAPTLGSGSVSQGMTLAATNTSYSFIFNSALTGYFALVFKDTYGSGDWRIQGLSIEYNKKILDSITIGGDCSTKTYNDGASLSTAGLTVTANYSDGTTADVTASATLTPATNPLTVGTTSVVVNASYTEGGVNKVASKTITGITVNAILVTSITLNKSSTTIGVGGTEQLSVSSILPSNATNKTVTWSVYSGSSFASVSSTGLVTAIAAGEAVIRATANDGSEVYGACTVTVQASATYTVTYDGNGNTSGTVPTDSTNYSSGDPVTVAGQNGLAKTGYDFGGWNTQADGNGTNYAAGSGTFSISGNTILYAKWTVHTYTITYKDQNNAAFSGTHASGYPTTHTYGTATTLKTATKSGYTFGGWFTNSSCTGSAVTTLGATAYSQDIILYAKWTADQTEQVFYNLNTFTSGSNNSYAGNCDVTVNGITWNINGNSQVSPWKFGGKSITKVDRTLYTKTAMSDDITKVVLNGVQNSGSITVHSIKLIVSTGSDGTGTVKSTLTAGSTSGTITFTRPNNTSWANCYYKLVFNVTVSGSKNKQVWFTSMVFYSMQ